MGEIDCAFEKWADDAATLSLSATVDLAALLFKSQILRQKVNSKGMFFYVQAAKRECDKVIDKNGPPPKGTGIKQLRENIVYYY